MFSYYARVIYLSFLALPTALGSNWLGLLWPAFVVAVGEIIAACFYGRKVIIEKWRKAAWIGSASLVLCYFSLFACCALAANYREYAKADEERLSSRAKLISANADEKYAVLQAQSECSETVGKNETLEKQNRDQQSSINNCQTEAIKRLIPEMENHGSWEVLRAGNEHLKSYIYTTNRPIPPTAIVLRCDRDVTDVDAFIMGSPFRYFPRYKVTGEHTYTFQTPVEWSPVAPIQINLSFTGAPPECTAQRTDK